MNLIKQKKYLKLSIYGFFILNILNTYFLTNQVLNRYISPVARTLVGEITAVFGNLSILILFFVLGISIFKKDKSVLKYNIVITLILNIAVFALGIFTLYYSTAFTTNAFDIFKNPAEGMAQGMVLEVLSELVLYYRILVFLPVIILFVLYILYKKQSRVTNDEQLMSRNAKKYFLGYFSFIVIFFASLISFSVQLSKDEFKIGGVISTKATQNLGVYPYYLLEFLNVDFNYVTAKSLNVVSDENLYDAYDLYNKNKDEYLNVLDNQTYSNKLLVKDSKLNQESIELLNLNEDDKLNGIFKDKNLILVHLESLNYFLWQLPEVRERFDFLNEIFQESFVFENYYTSVGMGVSSDAEASVLTGLYMNGYSTFYRDYDKYNFEIDTLPKLFTDQSYRSLAIHGDYEIFYNRDIAYKEMMGFTGLNDDNYYYSLEDFAKNDTREGTPVLNNSYTSDYELARAYANFIKDNGKKFNEYNMISPWPSEFELGELTYNKSLTSEEKHMILSLYMTPHTPFEYNPYIYEKSYDLVNGYAYNNLKELTKKYIDFASYVDDSIKSFFIDPDTNKSRINEDNVYVFYSDHGSSIKNGDLVSLFASSDKEIDLLEERRMLQQTISFIYAPSSIKQENGINKGLLTGVQDLSRGHIDLYRTIGELFGLFSETDFYFGVNGLSNEPTYVIDNRISDLVIDNLDYYEKSNYIPTFLSLRNTKNIYPKDAIISEESIKYIKRFKMLSDLLVSTKDTYKRLKILYNK